MSTPRQKLKAAAVARAQVRKLGARDALESVIGECYVTRGRYGYAMRLYYRKTSARALWILSGEIQSEIDRLREE